MSPLPVLSASSLPWIGSDFTSTLSGWSGNPVAIDTLGLATNPVPLVSLLPTSAPGCTLYPSPDYLRVAFPAGSAMATTLLVPRNTSLIGQAFHQQVILIEFSGAMVTSVSATNSLSMTIGAL